VAYDIPQTIDLLALEEQAVVPVTLPTGRQVELHFLDQPGYALLARVYETGSDEDAARVLAHILPGATPAEVACLSPAMIEYLTLVASRKIRVASAVLEGNGGGPPAPPSAPAEPRAAPSAPSRRPRSGRRTRPSTPAAGSGGSKAATSSPSADSPTTAP